MNASVSIDINPGAEYPLDFSRLFSRRGGSHMGVTVAAADSSHTDFLRSLYFDTRAAEVASWGFGAAEAQQFLEMQYRAREMSYGAQFPRARCGIITRGNEPVGRVLLDEAPGGPMRIVDIAVLTGHQNKGIGSAVIQAIQQAAADGVGTVRLGVAASNDAALRLYKRLGFTIAAADSMTVAMEWKEPRA